MRRLKSSWRPFLAGMATFIISQIVHLPMLYLFTMVLSKSGQSAVVIQKSVVSMLLYALAMGLMAGLIISSRVNDYRVAQQLGGVVVLPIVGLSIFVLLGKLYLTVTHILMMTITVFTINIIVLLIAVELFERETILTRWK